MMDMRKGVFTNREGESMSAEKPGASFLLVMLLAVFGSCAADAPQDTAAARSVKEVCSMDGITVVVTDSGLGGLAIVADAARKLKEKKAYRDVELIFYNALFTEEGGYNSLSEREHKVRIFSRALRDMQERYAPDVIFIACNTLSVLYGDTEFAAETQTPVVDIVGGGVDLIASRMRADDRDRVIIFATETTVDEGTHKTALIQRGVDPDRIVLQKCPELASYIEQGFDSIETGLLIDAYVDEALTASGKIEGNLFAGLNCTHYGYAIKAWRDAFETRGVTVAEFLNPNDTMFDVLLPDSILGRCDSVEVRVRAVSMVEIPEESRESLGRLLDDLSPDTAAALRNYELKPDLFRWRDVLQEAGGGR
jgi:glutamate racemase